MNLGRSVAALVAGALSVSAQFPDFKPPTPLIGAAIMNNAPEVKRLLDAGADPNEGLFVGAPPIFMGLINHNAGVVKLMVAKGANVNARDGVGATPLMWAATNEYGDPELVQFLLDKGADPNIRDKNGDTALRWAMRRGYTPIVSALKNAGASDAPLIRDSVTKAIALLQKSGPQFVRVSGCISCHNQSVPQMVYSAARQRGFTVDEQNAQEQVKSVVAVFRPYLSRIHGVPDPAITLSYTLLGLAAEGYGRDEVTDAMVGGIGGVQIPDGSFVVMPARPPIESSRFSSTALSLRALQLYGKDSEDRVRRGRDWLAANQPRTNEERTMRLLGLRWANADAEVVAKAARELLAMQQSDGGWAQLANMETDAYATGQALVALNASGQLATSDPAYQRGVAYLLRTQMDDGSWLVRTRSYPFQPYKESGFPHGRHQWISAMGTSWASLALTLTQPIIEEKKQLSRVF